MRHWRPALAGIGVVALLVRLIYLHEIKDSALLSVLIGDSLQFDILARRILAGDWAGSDVFYQAQLYPYFLALVYSVFGIDWFSVRVVQAVLGAASCVLLAVAGRRFFDARTGLFAAGLLAAYPPAVFFDGLIQKSSPDLFLMAALLVATGACLDQPRARWIVLMGVVVGALSWNRENARVLYVVIAAWLLVWQRETPLLRRAQHLLLLTLGAAAVLGPVMMRNARVSGELVLTTSQAGPNFYIGNHAGASGGYEPLVEGRGNALFEREDAVRIAEAAAGRQLSPGEVSDYWWQRALADIRQAPGAWVRLLAKKTWLTFAAGEPLDTESLEAYASSSPLLSLLRWFTFGIVMALAVFGAWMTRSSWRRLVILYGMFVAMALSVVAFFVFARYRFPLVPIAMLFAGAGLAAIIRVRTAAVREWLPGAAAAGVAALVLHIPVATSADETYANYGAELIRQERPADAIPLLREAVRRAPDHPRAHLDLALAVQKSGGDAEQEFRVAIARAPSAEAYAGLAMTLHRRGRLDEAVRAYSQAVELNPSSIEATSNLAVALLEAGKSDEALAVFERASALQPRNAALRLNLCHALTEVRRGADALACYREAASTAREPRDVLEANYALAEAAAAGADTAEAISALERARAAARALGDTTAAARIDQSLQILRTARGR